MRHPNIMVLILLLLLVGCGNKPQLQKTYPQIPPYPNATNRTLEKPDPRKISNTIRIVRFNTTDSVEEVLAFYDQELPEGAWALSKYDPPRPFDQRHYTYGMEAEYKASLSLYIYVTVENGSTQVELNFAYDGPGYAFPPDYPFPPGFN